MALIFVALWVIPIVWLVVAVRQLQEERNCDSETGVRNSGGVDVGGERT